MVLVWLFSERLKCVENIFVVCIFSHYISVVKAEIVRVLLCRLHFVSVNVLCAFSLIQLAKHLLCGFSHIPATNEPVQPNNLVYGLQSLFWSVAHATVQVFIFFGRKLYKGPWIWKWSKDNIIFVNFIRNNQFNLSKLS